VRIKLFMRGEQLQWEDNDTMNTLVMFKTHPGEGWGMRVQIHQEVLASLFCVPTSLHMRNVLSITHGLHEGWCGTCPWPKDPDHTLFQKVTHCKHIGVSRLDLALIAKCTQSFQCPPVCDAARLSFGGTCSGRATSVLCRIMPSELMVCVVYWNTSSSWISVLWNSPPEFGNYNRSNSGKMSHYLLQNILYSCVLIHVKGTQCPEV
jgi:hypothetical protein